MEFTALFCILLICVGGLLGALSMHAFQDKKEPPKTNKSELTDTSADDQIKNEMAAMQARLKILENEKSSKTANMEIRDALRLVREEQTKMREEVLKSRERVVEIVTNLLASYRPRERTKRKTGT